MLRLTDEALARVLIAGSAVAPDRQAAWLEDLAVRFERASHRALLTSYTRAWRRRQRAGLVQLKVVADEANLAVFLIDAGLLDPLRADDRGALTRATERALALMCETSPPVGANLDTIRASLVLSALQSREPPCPTTTSSDDSETR
jgi:hypothetical protein